MKFDPLPVPLTEDERGIIRVTGTRVPLHLILDEFWQRQSPEDVRRAFPSLSLADIYSVLAWDLRQHEVRTRR